MSATLTASREPAELLRDQGKLSEEQLEQIRRRKSAVPFSLVNPWLLH